MAAFRHPNRAPGERPWRARLPYPGHRCHYCAPADRRALLEADADWADVEADMTGLEAA